MDYSRQDCRCCDGGGCCCGWRIVDFDVVQWLQLQYLAKVARQSFDVDSGADYLVVNLGQSYAWPSNEQALVDILILVIVFVIGSLRALIWIDKDSSRLIECCLL